MPRLFVFSYVAPNRPRPAREPCYVMAQITASHIAAVEKAQQAMDEMKPGEVEIKLNCDHWMQVDDESLWPSESLNVPLLSQVGIDGRPVIRLEMTPHGDDESGRLQSKPIEIKGLLLAYQAAQELGKDSVYVIGPEDSTDLVPL